MNTTLEETTPGNTTKTLLDAIAAKTIQGEYKGVPVYVVPKNMEVKTLENLVEQQLERPYKLKQHVKLLSAASFIEYYNRFATDHSTIFVDIENALFTAVLDYHEAGNCPDWKHHTATYSCPKTNEWNSWIAHDNEKMDQETFALFIEDNLKEISEPDGATMLEVASSLKSNTKVDFKQSTRLDNGQVQFNYTETIDGVAGNNGQLTIPEIIKIIVKPFLSGAPYEIEARFRYRMRRDGLSMWYSLMRPHLIKQDAVNDVIESVRKGISKGQILEAQAPQ